MVIGFITLSLLNIVISYLFYTPKMRLIEAENRDLILQYEILQDRIASTYSKLQEIRHRDQNVYRMLFSSDTTTLKGVYTPYPNSKYEDLMDDDYTELMNAELTEEQKQRLADKMIAITGKKIDLICREDPAVLGGIRLRYDGKQVDGTVQSRLAAMEKSLKNTVL